MGILDGDVREKFHKLLSEAIESEKGLSDSEAVISIGTAAKMLKLSVSALRKYEKEGLLIYGRSEAGRRLLSRSDIHRIKIIRRMINEIGLNMEGIRRLLALLPCWTLKPCSDEEKEKCSAFLDPVGPCWMLDETECARKRTDCSKCNVYLYGAYCTEQMKSFLHHRI
jgi:MerR family transcriptional regulator/heat shock protein HspR